MKKLTEGQKDRIRAAELPILPSSFLSETLEKRDSEDHLLSGQF